MGGNRTRGSMNTQGDGGNIGRAAELARDWAQSEPRLARLLSGAAQGEFYRRLRGEYRVAACYGANMLAAGISRYGRQLQVQGLRAMAHDPIAGAAEYIVGVYFEALAPSVPELQVIRQRAWVLINDAIALAGPGGSGRATA